MPNDVHLRDANDGPGIAPNAKFSASQRRISVRSGIRTAHLHSPPRRHAPLNAWEAAIHHNIIFFTLKYAVEKTIFINFTSGYSIQAID
jgi:hypothetical protein